jgi:hypothetical protein
MALSRGILVAAALSVVWCGAGFHSDPSITHRPTPAHTISGLVFDDSGPCIGARVRLPGQDRGTWTDAKGEFRLISTRASAMGEIVTAWKPRHFIASDVVAEANPTRLHLRPWPDADYPDYRWVDPSPQAESFSCGTCHRAIFDEWHRSAHGSARSRFRRIWNELDQHQPERAAVCLSCHDPAPIRPSDEWGSFSESGVHCDFCHKVVDAPLALNGLTHGRFALDLLRPKQGQLIVGPWIDSPRPENSYAPIQRSSRLCASCHEGVIFGLRVYETYSEWLASPAGQRGIQCQDCHMKPTGQLTNVAPGHGGVDRDPRAISNHRFVDNDLLSMLRRAIHVDVTVQLTQAVVRVTALNVGHRVPTGSPDRQLILEVRFLDSANRRLGHAHRLFAKRLRDERGNLDVPFWQATLEFADSRLFPDQAWEERFDLPAGCSRVEATILYRRHVLPNEGRLVADEVVVHRRERIVGQRASGQ